LLQNLRPLRPREKAQRELIAVESQLELLARLARTWEISLPN